MITVLTYLSIITGVIVVIMMSVSLFSGLNLDFDLDTDTDIGEGGLGVIKSLLTFLSISSWVIRIILLSGNNIWVASVVGLIAGIIAVWLLSYMFKLLLKNEENVNWQIEDTIYKQGVAYLRLPPKGEGIVQIHVNGVNRELKAKNRKDVEINTGDKVIVVEVEGTHVIVDPV